MNNQTTAEPDRPLDATVVDRAVRTSAAAGAAVTCIKAGGAAHHAILGKIAIRQEEGVYYGHLPDGSGNTRAWAVSVEGWAAPDETPKMDAVPTGTRTRADEVLDAAVDRVRAGYAEDLLLMFVDNDGGALEAGDLFRTLVLDESWSIGDAADVYRAASEVADRA